MNNSPQIKNREKSSSFSEECLQNSNDSLLLNDKKTECFISKTRNTVMMLALIIFI